MQHSTDDIHLDCDRNNGALGFFTTGTIDEVRFYGRVLGDAEIAVLAAP